MAQLSAPALCATITFPKNIAHDAGSPIAYATGQFPKFASLSPPSTTSEIPKPLSRVGPGQDLNVHVVPELNQTKRTDSVGCSLFVIIGLMHENDPSTVVDAKCRARALASTPIHVPFLMRYL